MKKIINLIIRLPILLVRWLNAAIMRLPFAYIILMSAFTTAYYYIKDDGIWSSQTDFAVYLGFSAILSLIWGLIYTLSKPPIIKKVYRRKSNKTWGVIGRLLFAVVFFLIYRDMEQSELLRALLLFWAAEMLVNSILIIASAKTAQDIANVIRVYRSKYGNHKSTNKKPSSYAKTYSSSTSSATTRMTGEDGENEVDYNIKWLTGSGYKIVEKILNEKTGKKEIRLRSRKVSNETQEFDHIVVGHNGIFNIETKTYSGTIYFDEKGNWRRIDKYGTKVSDKNPIAQIDRHHMVLAGLLGDSYPIVDILCIAHPDAELKVSDNAPIPIIKGDMLTHYIQNYKTDKQFSDQDIEKIVALIEKGRVRVYDGETSSTPAKPQNDERKASSWEKSNR